MSIELSRVHGCVSQARPRFAVRPLSSSLLGLSCQRCEVGRHVGYDRQRGFGRRPRAYEEAHRQRRPRCCGKKGAGACAQHGHAGRQERRLVLLPLALALLFLLASLLLLLLH